MNLAEMRAKRAAAHQETVAEARGGTQVPAQAPAEQAPTQVQAEQDPAVGLDFNDEDATPKFDEKIPRIPWDIDIQSTLELVGLVHVHAKSCTFYKAEVKVLTSNHPDVRVGTTRCLLYYYEPNPRKEQEEWGNNATKREMRKLAAALADEDVKNTAFDANKLLGDLQKDTIASNGVSLGIPFGYEQYNYINKNGAKKYGAKYSFAA